MLRCAARTDEQKTCWQTAVLVNLSVSFHVLRTEQFRSRRMAFSILHTANVSCRARWAMSYSCSGFNSECRYPLRFIISHQVIAVSLNWGRTPFPWNRCPDGRYTYQLCFVDRLFTVIFFEVHSTDLHWKAQPHISCHFCHSSPSGRKNVHLGKQKYRSWGLDFVCQPV